MCQSPLATWLNECAEQIRHEPIHGYTGEIIRLGAAEPGKWQASPPDAIPTAVYWSWLVSRPGSHVTEIERDMWHEDEEFQAAIHQMVEAVVSGLAGCQTCAGCDYWKPASRTCPDCETVLRQECVVIHSDQRPVCGHLVAGEIAPEEVTSCACCGKSGIDLIPCDGECRDAFCGDCAAASLNGSQQCPDCGGDDGDSEAA